MRLSAGFNPLATTNGARLQGEVILRLVQDRLAREPASSPLLIRHDDWFHALLTVSGIDADRAPVYARLAHQHEQDIVADGSPGIVRRVLRGTPPRRAADVTISWPAKPGAAHEYSYEDTLSTPRLKVTNKRVIQYRLLDLDGVIVFDEIEGLAGRPTTGPLGLLFQVIGEGRVVQYRMAISPDGVQVSRGRARKAFFEVATTVTVWPDGRSEKGTPPEPGLRSLARRLEMPLELEYRPRP